MKFAKTPIQKSISLANLSQLALPDEEYLLGALITAGSLGMIFGPRGGGKSFLGSMISYAICGEKELMPWGKGFGQNILYLDGEMKIHGFRDRLLAIENASAVSSRTNAAARFHVLSRDLAQHPIGYIDTVDGQKALEQHIPIETKLLIIDNLSAWTSQSAEDINGWQIIEKWLIAMRLNGIAVLLIHHSGKTGSQRGTSAHEDLLDYSIKLTPTTDGVKEGETAFKIEHVKLRSHLPDLRKTYKFVFSIDDNKLVFDSTPANTDLDVVTEEWVALLNDEVSAAEVGRRYGVNRSTVIRRVKQFKEALVLSESSAAQDE